MRRLYRYSISLLYIVLGIIIGVLLTSRYTTRVTNSDAISWDVDRALHVAMLVNDRTDDVIDINMNVIEKNITKTDYKSEYPGAEKKISFMAGLIENIYRDSDKPMPEHVSAWISRHKLPL